MTFYQSLDSILKQDEGGRGLLQSIPQEPIRETAEALKGAKRAILLTGFPVRLSDGTFIGETDGPSGTANIAAALAASGCQVRVVTDRSSYPILQAALSFRAPGVPLVMLPESGTEDFIRRFIRQEQPTHFISLERPGKASDGHYHNMRGEVIDDMITDSAVFLREAKKAGAVTISIGDGGNEMGMGAYRQEVEAGVPCGSLICASERADLSLVSGVSNWWGWGISALLSLSCGRLLLPTAEEETRMLALVTDAGAVDGCTKKHEATVDHLPLPVHLHILEEITDLTQAQLTDVRP